MPTIGACLIVGPNREDQLKRLLPQLSELDKVVIVDTYSGFVVKNLVKKYKNCQVIFDPWRPTWKTDKEEYGPNDWGFARARNISLQNLTTDYGFWIDTDDILGLHYQGEDRSITAKAVKEGFLKIIKEAPDTDVWFADYHYSYDEHGLPNVVHARERLFRNPASWKVVYPIHECFVPDHPVRHAMIQDIKFIHLPNAEKTGSSSDRNMQMLTDWIAQLEYLGDTEHAMQRARLLYGDTLWGQERYREAADYLENTFLAKHPTAISIEKWQAACFACKSYIQIGNLGGARRMALMALDFEPGLPDAYNLLAEIKLLNEEDPTDILHLIDTAARMPDPPAQVIKNPRDYDYTPFLIASECKYQLKQYESALDLALKALRILPNDPKAESFRRKAAEQLRANEGQQAALGLYQLLNDFDEHEKAAQLFNLLPYAVQQQLEIINVGKSAQEKIGHLMTKEEYEKYYSDLVDWEPIPWNFLEENKIPGRDRFEYILSRLKSRSDIKKVLWTECGDGFYPFLLEKVGYQVVGLDLNKEGLRIARERAEKLGSTVQFVDGWIESLQLDRLPLDDGTFEGGFDAVVASETLDHARDVEFYLESLGDAIRPGGIIVLTTPDGNWDGGERPYSKKDGRLPKVVRAFTQRTLEELLKSNGDFWLTECHFLPYSSAYRENQGWVVAELVKILGLSEPLLPGGVRVPEPNAKRITIACGENVEPFSPLSFLTGGIGGSETAVIHMSKNWSAMGYRVAVYANNIGIYDGVLYRHFNDWSPEFKSDIFIAWRLPHLFAKGRPNARKTVLWCHDVSFPIDVKKEWVDNIDVIAVVSEWHKNYIMSVHPFPEEKMYVSRNGIDQNRFLQKVEKQPHTYFFSSSHDRGLEELLTLWPKLKKEIPDAVLHVGYGTYTASRAMKDRHDYSGLEELRALENSMFELPGVIYHGRLNQWELAKVQLSCEAWLYPYQHAEKWGGHGGFPETAGITKFEAMAAGAVPFTRLNAALPERLPHCIEWTENMTDDDVIDILKNLDRHWSQEKTEENRRYAMTEYRWDTLAMEWLDKLM